MDRHAPPFPRAIQMAQFFGVFAKMRNKEYGNIFQVENISSTPNNDRLVHVLPFQHGHSENLTNDKLTKYDKKKNTPNTNIYVIWILNEDELLV